MDRRHFLQLGGAACLASTVPQALMASPITDSVSLTTKASKAKIPGSDYPATAVWSFNGQVPGVPLRVHRGDTLDVVVSNELDVPTSVHWHGIRLPNAMDGVSGLTQETILPGKSFRYAFAPPDAGTYWYHSHTNAYEQVARGLYGPLIVEDDTPPTVDRDLIWMVDDWRLQKDASIQEDFGAGHDRSHAGRIGNVPTVNGRYQSDVAVRTGERIRLRLINAANARNFALSFGDLEPMVIAVDGQAITPYQATDPIVIGAAGRVDVIIDMADDPGSTTSVTDHYYPAFPYTSYSAMTTQDMVDLKTWLNTVKPVATPAPAHDIPWPVSLRPSLVPWKALYFDPLRDIDTKDRSAYLVNGPAHCAECHSPRNLLGGLSQRAMTGNERGPEGESVPGISTADLSDWTVEDLELFLEVGMTPSGDFTGGHMSDVIEFSTGLLTTDDRTAIANYLLSEENQP